MTMYIFNELKAFIFVLGTMFLFNLGSNGSEVLDSGIDIEDSKKSPLGVRQQRIKRMVSELENQFSELARLLQKENPEQAEKLVDAFKTSKELLLEKRMDDITKLLDLSKLDSANEEQKKTIYDIKGLIDFLLKDEDEAEGVKDEIKKLEEWKRKLEDLIQDENDLKEESDIHSDKDSALKKMDQNMRSSPPV